VKHNCTFFIQIPWKQGGNCFHILFPTHRLVVQCDSVRYVHRGNWKQGCSLLGNKLETKWKQIGNTMEIVSNRCFHPKRSQALLNQDVTGNLETETDPLSVCFQKAGNTGNKISAFVSTLSLFVSFRYRPFGNKETPSTKYPPHPPIRALAKRPGARGRERECNVVCFQVSVSRASQVEPSHSCHSSPGLGNPCHSRGGSKNRNGSFPAEKEGEARGNSRAIKHSLFKLPIFFGWPKQGRTRAILGGSRPRGQGIKNYRTWTERGVLGLALSANRRWLAGLTIPICPRSPVWRPPPSAAPCSNPILLSPVGQSLRPGPIPLTETRRRQRHEDRNAKSR